MELHNSVPHYIAQVPAGPIALSNRPSRFGKKPKSSRPWRLSGSKPKTSVIRAIHGKQSNKGTSVPHYMSSSNPLPGR